MCGRIILKYQQYFGENVHNFLLVFDTNLKSWDIIVFTKNIWSTLLVDFFKPYFRFEIPLGLSKIALFRYFIWFLSQQKSTKVNKINVDQNFCCWKVWHLSFLNPCRTLFHYSHNTLYNFVKICLFSKAKYESKFIEKIFSSKFWLYNIRWQSGNFANEYIWAGPL